MKFITAGGFVAAAVGFCYICQNQKNLKEFVMSKLQEQEVQLNEKLSWLRQRLVTVTELGQRQSEELRAVKAALEAKNAESDIDLTDEIEKVDTMISEAAAVFAEPVVEAPSEPTQPAEDAAAVEPVAEATTSGVEDETYKSQSE